MSDLRGFIKPPIPTEIVDVIRRLWQDGRSSSEIAAKLGDRTRSSVMGVVNRGRKKEGPEVWPIRAKTPKEASEIAHKASSLKRKATPKKPKKPKKRGFILNNPSKPHFRTEPQKPKFIPSIGQTVLFMERKPNQCAWIDGEPKKVDPDYLWCCGRPVKGEGSYCQHHYAIVYKPIDELKRLR